ncbi:MAG TPA: hypothetical protein VKT49_26155 [Bryobacteraceae bacterium]|nr:hypothetical protein [Bryobacteraceae bacterium]
MIHDDLAQLADELQKLGVDATHEILYGPHGGLEGLSVGEDFFPLWELKLPENEEDFASLDFAAIRARRGPGWSIERPRRAHA